MSPPWLDPEAARSALGFPLVELPPSATTSAQAAIDFLVAHARSAGLLNDGTAEAALRAALWREQQASTAVGGGLALPHAKVDDLPRPTGVLGHTQAGVNWPSPDGEPVRLVCLLLADPRGGTSLRFLEGVLRY